LVFGFLETTAAAAAATTTAGEGIPRILLL